MMDVQMGLPLARTERPSVKVQRLVLPYLPPSKNVYDGWQPTWKSGHKKKWVRDIGVLADELDLPRGLPTVGLAARLVFPAAGRRDPQNYAQTLWHFVPDALVRCGVLVDDREGCLEIGPNWGLEFSYDRRQVDKKHRKRTILTIAWRDEGW